MKITIPIEPKPAPRPRFSRYGGAYMPKEFQEYKAQIADEASIVMAGNAPLEGALKTDIKFFCRTKKITSRKAGDVDNLAKSVLDALNGVIWKDDSQIVQCSLAKFHSETPCIMVEVETLND